MSVPIGLARQLDIISPEKETEIVQWLDNQEWSSELSRRTQHYGFEYTYKSKSIVPGRALEGPILELAQMIERAGIMKPTQCIVNEYFRNQGIAPHIDNLGFGPIVLGISINADGVMIFENGIERFECFLPQRSMIMLSNDARYKWKHSINKTVTYLNETNQKVTKPQDYRRISLTYRELATTI